MRNMCLSAAGCVLSTVIIAIAPSLCDGADGHLSVRIIEQSGEVTSARAWVDVNGQRLFQPTQPDSATPYARDKSFSCDGRFTIVVPAGRATIHVEKGKEFLPAEVHVDIVAGQTSEKTIQINRW
ncbi:MAG: hypothetical protein GY826_33405, partial [Fuerstiella sp.]|nr:hypothetical protein [Fuerstiella sp.]